MDMKTMILNYVMQKADEGRINAALHAGASTCANEIAAFVTSLPEIDAQTTGSGDIQPRRESPPKSDPRATITKGVLEVLRDSAEWMMPSEVIQSLRARGLDPQPANVRKILSGGVVDGVLERRAHRYRVKP